ncbi:MAG TPA: PAS domain-containing protein [Xanthobacteraceae bacterium]|nr:PAS domain-containing protein [Xanthobacteraceae bacterium]
MLQNLSDKVRLCYARAAEAKERAEEAADPEAKADFLKMERRWLLLARSFALGERLDDFTRDNSRRMKLARAFEPYAMLQASGAAVFGKDKDSRMIVANPACLSLLGKRWEDVRGRNDVEWHTDRVQARDVLSNDRLVIESKQAHVYEEWFNTPLGLRIILSTKAPLLDADGEIVGLVGVAKDITDRKKREEETKFLHNELTHQLRNSLSLVHAIARQTISPGDGLHRFEERLLAYARSQELILHRLGRMLTLHDLVAAHRLAFNMDSRVTVEGPNVPLTPDWAIQVGIAVHELATNSVKYGALGSDGQVKIFWTLENAEELDLNLVFSWHEIHNRVQTKPDHPGFGYTVLTHIVPERLNGLASLELKPGEVRWTLRASLTC